jgi:hypothetical protein
LTARKERSDERTKGRGYEDIELNEMHNNSRAGVRIPNFPNIYKLVFI